jgi:hypothetical protein
VSAWDGPTKEWDSSSVQHFSGTWFGTISASHLALEIDDSNDIFDSERDAPDSTMPLG